MITVVAFALALQGYDFNAAQHFWQWMHEIDVLPYVGHRYKPFLEGEVPYELADYCG